MTDNSLTIRARSIARCLSYNDCQHEAAAKRTLLELAHRLDALDISVFRNSSGWGVRDGLGQSRFMTFREVLLWRLFAFSPRTAR